MLESKDTPRAELAGGRGASSQSWRLGLRATLA